jgi:predicted enzyme related to lactoylglutathione lyase
MSSNPVAWFEIVGPDAKRLRDYRGALFGWSMDVMDADPDGHMVGLSHGATAV